MATNELSLKLLIDTKSQKVCFAEVGSDVILFLSSLLCLPVSSIVSLLTKERMVGSIGNVLDSVEKLDDKYLISGKSKNPYLSPPVAPDTLSPLQRLLDAPVNVSTSFFTCKGKETSLGIYDYKKHVPCGYFSAIAGSKCPSCSHRMNINMPHAKTTDGFVVGTATYTIKDDLSMTPASSVSSITLLAECGAKDLSTLQEKTVKMGKEEALEMLFASLKSKTVLTDVFLKKKKVQCKKETAA